MTSPIGTLPQLAGQTLITDGGLETELIFHRGFDLPAFAAFPLLADPEGRAVLRAYYDGYAAIARDHGVGLVLESPTWRANPDWAAGLGYDPDALDAANRDAIAFLRDIRAAHEGEISPIVLSGCVGPRGDGYVAGNMMDAPAARAYHARQIEVFAQAGADMVAAITMTYADEAIGIVHAAADAGLPAAISFTVETDGRLPSGQALADAIDDVDSRSGGGPAYYMVNCAHPTHFAHVLDGGEWVQRIGGIRANASVMSHAELDEAEELDDGDPVDLGARHAALRGALPGVRVLGGCCGTDQRHVRSIIGAWLADR